MSSFDSPGSRPWKILPRTRSLAFHNDMNLGVLCSTLLLLHASSHGEEKESLPLLLHDWKGGLSPLASTHVRISNRGEVDVTVTPIQKKPYSYQTTLSEAEVKQLNELLDASGLFKDGIAQPDLTKRPPITDTGITSLEVNRDEQRRSLEFYYEPALAPLEAHLNRLVFQAQAIHEIDIDGDIYSTTGRLGYLPSPVLQPDRLKEPLAAFIAKSTDRQRLEWALTGLARISSAKEFAATVAGELKKEQRTNLMCTAIPEKGNLPEGHEAELCPVFLDFLKTYNARPDLSEEKKFALERLPGRLAEQDYTDAIPFFVDSGRVLPLARMGVEGMLATLPFLESKDETLRYQAIEAFALAARLTPAAGHHQSYGAEEWATMLPILKEKVLPRLTKMAKDDPAFLPRTTAAREIERITADLAR